MENFISKFYTNLSTQQINAIDQLDTELRSVMDFYYSKGMCPCRFPRLRQFLAIDCRLFGGTFHCHESNALFNALLKRHLEEHQKEGTEPQFQCRVCGTQMSIDCSEYGFVVERKVLLMKNRALEDLGAAPLNSIPVFIGFIGYNLPKTANSISTKKVDIPEVIDYLTALRIPYAANNK